MHPVLFLQLNYCPKVSIGDTISPMGVAIPSLRVQYVWPWKLDSSKNECHYGQTRDENPTNLYCTYKFIREEPVTDREGNTLYKGSITRYGYAIYDENKTLITHKCTNDPPKNY